jgi:predicted NBD/HSP70 family sugar kinase
MDIKPSSQQLIKEANLKLVFKLIYDNVSISRADIANITNLSPTTISSLADELIKEGLVIATGTGSLPSSGRKPVLLSVNAPSRNIICIDLHEDGYYAAMFDLCCEQKQEYFIRLEDYNRLGISVISTIDSILKEHKSDKEKLLGLCIGAPGVIDPESMRIISSTIIPIGKDNNFYDIIKKWYPDKRIELINESALSAYCEKQFAPDVKAYSDLIYIDVHTGIGAGIIIDGQIFKGLGNMAGEFGHTSIDYNGSICKCGNRGCIERLASIPAVINSLCGTMRMNESQLYRFLEVENGDVVSKLARKYLQGHEAVKNALNEMAVQLTFAINNAVNLINPQIVIIGGQITAFGNEFIEIIRRTQKDIGLGNNAEVKISYSAVKGNHVTRGGAKYIFDLVYTK